MDMLYVMVDTLVIMTRLSTLTLFVMLVLSNLFILTPCKCEGHGVRMVVKVTLKQCVSSLSWSWPILQDFLSRPWSGRSL